MLTKIGIIGGSGLEKAEIFTKISEYKIDTKWGNTSSPLTEGMIEDVPVVFLSRHGYHHEISPTNVNSRANIQALKDVGCSHILASTAVGSLREEIEPGHLIVPDQFIDFTRARPLTFYDDFSDGIKHTSMADPFDAKLRDALIKSLEKLNYAHHARGTVVTIEGPRFSTRAESHMFRSWGADIINMSTSVEAILANEAQIPYAAIAMSTDYDSWRANTEAVTWEEIVRVMQENSAKVMNLFTEVVPTLLDI